MRRFLPLIVFVMLGISACSREESDANARKAGKAAHELAIETKEAAKKADRALERTAKDVREGWKEGQREEKSKDKK